MAQLIGRGLNWILPDYELKMATILATSQESLNKESPTGIIAQIDIDKS
jgi:hypothetical protein